MTDKSAMHRQLEVLGEHIRSVRLSHHLSQIGFATRAGFAGAYYSAIERGKLNFSVINLIKIAHGMGVEVGALFPPTAELVGIEGEGEAAGGTLSVREPDGSSYIEAGEGSPIEGQEQDEPLIFMSAGAAARLLNVDRRTVERWVRNGTLKPAAKVEDRSGKLYSLFNREDILMVAQRSRMG